MQSFYIDQRKNLQILMEGNQPTGGKYSYDSENRKKMPKNTSIPKSFIITPDSHTLEAAKYIDAHFSNLNGDKSPLIYPHTHETAQQALELFLDERFKNFGIYQDAIVADEWSLFHSILSPLINIGLLTPQDVLEKTLKYADKNNIPLNSLEGFIRQIIGWREFVRAAYLCIGTEQRSSNFFKHKKKLPPKFWQAKTGIQPVDNTIRKVLKYGHCHHIERLMMLGNFMLITETDPKDVYSWFMQNFVDAYDWVMVANVFGMSQFADGGKIVTKPYFSGSNYILKMSDYSKGDWTEIWDGLFWRFVEKHFQFFESNPRTKQMTWLYTKNKSSISAKIQKASLWLADYFS